jgi:phospholipid-binding lipoprotein MlaA
MNFPSMRARALLPCLVVAVLLPACATLPPGTQRDPRDRFERFNRSVYSFNSTLDRSVARPVARAYVKVTPAPVRTGIGNFFGNFGYTRVIVNDLLQGKLVRFLADTTRLLVNTTLGIGGLFDPAAQLGLAANDEDFGQTLGRWGVPAGPYLMLPLLGPSTVRDGVGLVADRYSEPDTYLVEDWRVQAGLTVGSLIDKRASLLGTDELLAQSYDQYAFLRSAYLQRREFQVKDGAVPPEDDFEIFEDEAPAEMTPATDSGQQAGQPAEVNVPAAQDNSDPPAPQGPAQ